MIVLYYHIKILINFLYKQKLSLNFLIQLLKNLKKKKKKKGIKFVTSSLELSDSETS